MIIQTNTFICENCDKIVSTTERTAVADDPVVSVPKGWDYNEVDIFVCDNCILKENQMKASKDNLQHASKRIADGDYSDILKVVGIYQTKNLFIMEWYARKMNQYLESKGIKERVTLDTPEQRESFIKAIIKC